MFPGHGVPTINKTSVISLRQSEIVGHSDKANFAFASTDGRKSKPEFRKFLDEEHPARRDVDTGGVELVQMNISIWNDGVGSKKGKKCDPLDVWTMCLTGRSREENYYASNINTIAVGHRMKYVSIVETIRENLVRLQREILVFNSETQQYQMLCGGLVMIVGDNPAASDLCSHMWGSDFSCRALATHNLTHGIANAAHHEESQRAWAAGVATAPNRMFQSWGFQPTPGYALRLAAWRHARTKKESAVKALFMDLAVRITAMNPDRFDSIPKAKQIIQWSGTFNGGSFRTLVQLDPQALLSLYATKRHTSRMRNLAHMWHVAAQLTKLMHDTTIYDLDSWSTEFMLILEDMLRTWEILWGVGSIRRKTKFHHLAHIPMWVRRFGPVLGTSVQGQESMNKYFRDLVLHTNRHSLSRDIMAKYALADGLQFTADEGLFVYKGSSMTRAGDNVKKFLTHRKTEKRSGSPLRKSSRPVLFVRRCAPFSEFVLLEGFHLIESQIRIGHRAVSEGLDIPAPTGQWSIKPIPDIIKVLNVQHLCGTECGKTHGPSAYLPECERMTGMLWRHMADDETSRFTVNIYMLRMHR
ncbi:hypothetical protein K470DRAFT_285954 [Piedraia hortae CBS 480.64]|uniref:Uncharacterized protein n=1 Tax=Piedraia hortae CBS 480.64 TaxID=1314780 RepID=A0A6A7C378_9PEZI|nr:hypothetical protein K470DRAFT_285954 [Piedraia hortae CBS 480.64]